MVSSVVARNGKGPPTTSEPQVCQVKSFTPKGARFSFKIKYTALRCRFLGRHFSGSAFCFEGHKAAMYRIAYPVGGHLLCVAARCVLRVAPQWSLKQRYCAFARCCLFFLIYTHGSSLNLFPFRGYITNTTSSSFNSGQLLGIVVHDRLV